MRIFLIVLYIFTFGLSQVQYNHPELNWQTFETDHFLIHFYDGTEYSAREGASVAEKIYPLVTDLYEYYIVSLVVLKIQQHMHYSCRSKFYRYGFTPSSLIIRRSSLVKI